MADCSVEFILTSQPTLQASQNSI